MQALIAFENLADYAASVSSVGFVRDPAKSAPDARVAEPAHYVLDRELAQGGMASLYVGQRLSRSGFRKTVVLKRLRADLTANAGAAALFLREAALGASLEHPAIVRVLDLTEIEGTPYLVMEYVRGGDLRLVLRRARRRNRQFLPAGGLYIGRELCAALDYAHGRCLDNGKSIGLIHRDISPANILLSIEGEVKLTDFGIAQADLELGGGPRARGQIGYMSPEQSRGETLDVRSDLFSLAAVLYEVLTGRRLFVGQVGHSPAEVYGTPVLPPSQIEKELPAELDAVLLRALSLSAAERPPSARALYQELLEISQRCRLWMDRASFADHLREVCGPDESAWSTLEERTGTALIASIAAEDVAEHDELSGSLAQQAAAMAAREDPFEPAITVPWPTVSQTPVVAGDSDDTVPFPSGPVRASSASPLADAAAALDADAASGSEERTVPSEKVERFLSGEHAVLTPDLSQSGHRPPVSLGVRFFLHRDRLIGIASGVLVGLALSALAWQLLGLSRCAPWP